MQSSLFKLDEQKVLTIPQSLFRAMELATMIIRSDAHKAVLTNLFQVEDSTEPHINLTDLSALVDQNEIFNIERIRETVYLDARACAIRKYEPWTVYLNPMMLLEMIDREREAAELTRDPSIMVDDQIQPLPPFTDATKTTRSSRRFNAIAYGQQGASKKKAPAEKKEEAPPERIMESRGAKRERPLPVPKDPPLVPSGMTVQEKNILMLTLMLVHEADHILNRALSTLLKDGNAETPSKFMLMSDDTKFTDVGHMIERGLYGFVIHHAYDPYYQTPFGIHEILGTVLEKSPTKYLILKPSPGLQKLLTCNDPCQVQITKDLLAMEPTGPAAYEKVYKGTRVVIGRMSTSALGLSKLQESSSDDEVVDQQFKKHRNEGGGDEDEEAEARFTGKA